MVKKVTWKMLVNGEWKVPQDVDPLLPRGIVEIISSKMSKPQYNRFQRKCQSIYNKHIQRIKKTYDFLFMQDRLLRDLGIDDATKITDTELDKFIRFTRDNQMLWFKKPLLRAELIEQLQKIKKSRSRDGIKVRNMKVDHNTSMNNEVKRDKNITTMISDLVDYINPFFQDGGHQHDTPVIKTETGRVVAAILNHYLQLPSKFTFRQVIERSRS